MSKELKLFSSYHGVENNITNHVGVVLRMVYRESPLEFEKLLFAICKGDVPLRVGPSFHQQFRGKRGIPDLVIEQTSFRVCFETKTRSGSFHQEQLLRHLKDLQNSSHDVRLLVGLSDVAVSPGRFPRAEKAAKKGRVKLAFLGFDELIESLRGIRISETLREFVEELEEYLIGEGVFPAWKTTLAVVNCGQTMDEIEGGAYLCPNRDGAYKSFRAAWLGPYKSKAVSEIRQLLGHVTCEPTGRNFQVTWNGGQLTDSELLQRARKSVKNRNPGHDHALKHDGLQIYVLGEAHPTDFRKASAGGLLGSRIFFRDLEAKTGAKTAKALATALKGRFWEDFR